MGRNVYDQFVGAPEILGNTEILGDPAMGLAAAPDADMTKFIQKGYTASDKIYFGLGNNFLLIAGAEALLVQSVQTPFKPLKATFPSQYCPDVLITQVKVGSVDLVEGDPIPIEVWSEVSMNNMISWPTLDVSQQMQVRLRNVGAVDVRCNIGFFGLRLR
jgi:hypothetical protein